MLLCACWILFSQRTNPAQLKCLSGFNIWRCLKAPLIWHPMNDFLHTKCNGILENSLWSGMSTAKCTKWWKKKHTQNNLNLCIFPISASKIFIMLKSQLKNIERGTCFIVVVNSMHQCYWFYRWIVWRVRCQMWSVWNVSVSPKSSNVLFFFFTLCSFSWTSWNSTSKSAELEMCYGKTQNQNTIKTKRINSKLVKNWLKSYRKTLIEWEIVEIVVKCKCVNVFWLCWKNKWCTISRIIEMD